MEWIPRAENGLTDYYFRIEDYDDWGISFHLLNLIQDRFGSSSIVWFVSDHNAKVKRFFSRFWNISCFGVDAFIKSSAFEFGLFVPPILFLRFERIFHNRSKVVLFPPIKFTLFQTAILS